MPQTDIVLCIEASHAKGMGHVSRTLRLARALRAENLSVLMVCNDDPAAVAMLRLAGVPFCLAPTDRQEAKGWERGVLEEFCPAVWFNDRLETGAVHAREILGKAKLATMDDCGVGGDLAECRIASMPCMFPKTRPKSTDYVGVEYLMLDAAAARNRRLRKDADAFDVLVSMGGSDTWGASVYVARQLLEIGQPATLLTGPAFAHDRQLDAVLRADTRGLLRRMRAVPALADIFPEYNVLLCAGGMTPFEAASNGLPVIALATEDHERANAAYVHDHGFGITMGERVGEGFTGDVGAALERVRVAGLSRMSEAGMRAIDAQGTARVASLLIGLLRKET